MSKEEIIKIIDDTLQEFYDCEGGETSFVFKDGDVYYTDTGYAIEGIEFFAERLKKKI